MQKDFFEKYNHGSYSFTGRSYLHYPRFGCDKMCYSYNYCIEEGYTEITIDQFKEYVLKISETMSEKRKIIGYKAPMDLFNGNYPKNTLWIKKTIDASGDYRPDDKKSTYNAMPKEIVETWEAIYEEEYKVGDLLYYNYDNVNKSDGTFHLILAFNDSEVQTSLSKNLCGLEKLQSGGYKNHIRKATSEEIKAFTEIVINKYDAEFNVKGNNTVNFGCKVISLDELQSIKKAFETFSRLEGHDNSQSAVSLDVQGKFNIDYNTICKLIDKLESLKK